MADKLLKYDVAMKSTKTVWQMDTPKCYTGDENTVTFDFNITDLLEADLVGVVPNVYLYMHDGSFFQIGPADGVTTTGTKVNYTMKGNEGKHSGIARAQLVLVWDDEINPPEKLTSQLYDFEVVSGLENKVAVEVMIQDWTTLIGLGNVDNTSDVNKPVSTAMQTALNLKANKAQEEWITPTLLNGFTSAVLPVRYKKDSLGFVHIQGQVENITTNKAVFVLPVGYRPDRRVLFSHVSDLTGVNYSLVDSAGTFVYGVGGISWADFGEVIFYAG